MLVFDEKKYAEKVFKNREYFTGRSQGKERGILVRYLSSLGKGEKEIIRELMKIPMQGGEYLTEEQKKSIFSKILSKANNYEFITGKEVNIYKEEIEMLRQVENESARDLLFIVLVYYKWATEIEYLRFFSKKNGVLMVVENNKELWKFAGVSKLSLSKRYELCNLLYLSGLYKIDNFKEHNYIYLPFVKEKGEIALTIKDFEGALDEFHLYEGIKGYMKCHKCGKAIKTTSNSRKYCYDCAKKVNIAKTMERRRCLK